MYLQFIENFVAYAGSLSATNLQLVLILLVAFFQQDAVLGLDSFVSFPLLLLPHNPRTAPTYKLPNFTTLHSHYVQISSFYHLQMRRNNALSHVCLSVCLWLHSITFEALIYKLHFWWLDECLDQARYVKVTAVKRVIHE